MHILATFTTSWQVARRSLAINRARTFLTILGIVIGVSSVILMLSLGRGAQSLILSQVASFGSQTIFVQAGSGDEQGGGNPGLTKQTMKLADIDKLKALPTLDLVSAVLVFNDHLVYQDQDRKVQIVGSMPEEQAINSTYPIAGRFFDTGENSPVAVLGYKIATDVFGSPQDALGQRVSLKKRSFRVIGVMQEQGTKFFTNFDNNVYIPLRLSLDMYGVDYVSYVSARAVGPVDLAKEDVRLAMRESHNLDNPKADLAKDDFQVASPADAAAIIDTVGTVLTLLLTSIAAISLVVGGIGIMNIMLVTVTERTREIGLRLAVGARRKDIMRQFLIETMILTLGGGAIGILLGVGLAGGAAAVLGTFVSGWKLVIPLSALTSGIGVSVAVGLLFGLYPARRASQLNPIDALRYE
jgi:putative ABC transport system permease protein